jgi:hypothetical protein
MEEAGGEEGDSPPALNGDRDRAALLLLLDDEAAEAVVADGLPPLSVDA